MMILILEVNDLWKFASTIVKPPIDVTLLGDHNKKDMNDKRFIIDEVKDHIITHLYERNTTKEMREALNKLY